MVSIVRDWVRIVILSMPWALLLLGAPVLLWWAFEPVPVRVLYVAPALLTQPASTREEAARYFTYEAPGGQVLWRYVEACIDKPIHDGESHRSWVSKALVWNAPTLPLSSASKVGCWSQSIAVDVPTSSPDRAFELRQWITIRTNPLRTDRIDYEPIPLRILDTSQKAR